MFPGVRHNKIFGNHGRKCVLLPTTVSNGDKFDLYL